MFHGCWYIYLRKIVIAVVCSKTGKSGKTTTCLMLQIHARASFKGYFYYILSIVVYSHPHFKVSIETNEDDNTNRFK